MFHLKKRHNFLIHIMRLVVIPGLLAVGCGALLVAFVETALWEAHVWEGWRERGAL